MVRCEALLCLLLVGLPACGEPAAPDTDEIEESAELEAPSAAEIEVELARLEGQGSIAARLRRDAFASVQAGNLERPTLAVHILRSGGIELADRDWPGHLLAGHGDYLRRFERTVLSALEERVGLSLEIAYVTVGESPTVRGPIFNLAFGGDEREDVETSMGPVPRLALSVSLMASFRSDPANAAMRPIEFFESPREPIFREGESPRRQLCGQPCDAAAVMVLDWMGQIEPEDGAGDDR
jgi:hypothetical protein